MGDLSEQEIAEGCKLFNDGSKRYVNSNGVYHRIGGPAVTLTGGTKVWYQNGKRHRLDGPAAEWASIPYQWYFEGELIDCVTQEEFERLVKLKVFW